MVLPIAPRIGPTFPGSRVWLGRLHPYQRQKLAAKAMHRLPLKLSIHAVTVVCKCHLASLTRAPPLTVVEAPIRTRAEAPRATLTPVSLRDLLVALWPPHSTFHVDS